MPLRTSWVTFFRRSQERISISASGTCLMVIGGAFRHIFHQILCCAKVFSTVVGTRQQEIRESAADIYADLVPHSRFFYSRQKKFYGRKSIERVLNIKMAGSRLSTLKRPDAATLWPPEDYDSSGLDCHVEA